MVGYHLGKNDQSFRFTLYNHNIKVENSVLFYNYRNTGTLGYYGEVYGDVTLSGDCTIKNGQTLFIPTGCSLTVNGTLDNQGTIYSKGALTANQITGNTVTKDKVDLNGTSYKTWAEACLLYTSPSPRD